MTAAIPVPSYASLAAGGRLSLLFWLSLLARLSFAMTSLSLFLLFMSEYGSPAGGGAAIAGFGIANVIATPIRGRLLDRYGTRFVLPVLGSAYGAMLVATIVTVSTDCPILIPLIFTVVAGLFLAPMGAIMRVRWADRYPETAPKARAYSVDAAAEETIYAIGPAAAGLIVGFVSPAAAMIATAGLGIAGTIGFSLLDREYVAPQADSADDATHARPSTSLLRQRGFVPLVLVLLMVGGGLGVFEVAAPVFGGNEGSSVSAGLLLTVFAVASALGGIAYGARTWRSALMTRFAVIAVAYFAILCVFVVADSLLWFTVVAAGFGVLFAPAMITGYMLVDTIGSPRQATERTSWVNAAMNSGAAIGSGIGGIVLASHSAGPVLAVCGVMGLAVIGLVVVQRLFHSNAGHATTTSEQS